MIAFINTFLSYLLLVIINAILIVIAVICGKKLRERKDAKEAAEQMANSASGQEET